MAKQTMRVYACGGCGTNLAYRLQKDVTGTTHAVNFAKIDIAYIDSSDSNAFDDIPESSFLHAAHMYGSGKFRAENADTLLDPEFIGDVMRRFEPAEVNVVIAGAGGGSGAVIAHGIVGRLMELGKAVVVFIVGSKATRVDVSNSMKTVKSLDNLVHEHKQPLALFYRENSKEISREQVDEDVHEALLSLSVLWSGNNRELDRRDLENWLRYDRVTTHPAELNQLLILGGGDTVPLNPGDVASVATLAAAGQSTDFSVEPEVQFVGYFQKNEHTASIDNQLPLHFVLTRSYFSEVIKVMDEKLSEHREIEKTRTKNAALTGKDEVRGRSNILL